MDKAEFQTRLNEWGRDKIPFLFWVDFEIQKPMAIKLSDVSTDVVLFYINGFTNASNNDHVSKTDTIEFTVNPISQTAYKKKFDYVKSKLRYGDSFLTNLTVKTEIKTNHTLNELFQKSKAKYKLWYRDEFLVFSPEIFIQIRDGKIFSYPMKGTINASIPNANEVLLNDTKELAEHTTIVDLIRNDLSHVATDVAVTKFRYIDELKTTTKNLLHVSSEIVGTLQTDYLANLGNLLLALLPAGSVSGAPKAKTLAIIREAEGEPRGFYTGVVGYFDGEKMDSGVMIRFIEKSGNKLFYRSGGGITAQSVLENEYQEIRDKIYVPID
jgi:para-aminobenzoate synthetase component I